MNEEDIGFWVFSLKDPRLYQFYTEHARDMSLYYILYVNKYRRDFSPEIKDVLQLQEDSILLIDSYLLPIFCRLYLKGYIVIISEKFCETDRSKALLKFCFSLSQPILNMGGITEYQRKCMALLYTEYLSPSDDLQPSMLRNLLANIALLSTEVNYERQFKSGHLLSYALLFVDLLRTHASAKRKKAFYADKMGITEKLLDKSLQVVYNKTFREMLTDRILNEAVRLLVFSDKNITQIAIELNFDVSSFIKLFIKNRGVHPKDLRTNYRILINAIENVQEYTPS
ncbi:MAG: helix-turn-helix domain-containing protein [Prevotella sp.]|jgi:AraC-like DNA-binding protein|nr:helix-turn-helix domain-containing protein [Prevotella sp.]